MEKEKILEIVRKKEEETDYVVRCVRVGVCPDCGDEYIFTLKEDGHPFLTTYKCGKGHSFLVND